MFGEVCVRHTFGRRLLPQAARIIKQTITELEEELTNTPVPDEGDSDGDDDDESEYGAVADSDEDEYGDIAGAGAGGGARLGNRRTKKRAARLARERQQEEEAAADDEDAMFDFDDTVMTVSEHARATAYVQRLGVVLAAFKTAVGVVDKVKDSVLTPTSDGELVALVEAGQRVCAAVVDLGDALTPTQVSAATFVDGRT